MTVLTVSAQLSKTSKPGITFAREEPGTPLTVKSIDKDGFFAYTALVPGLVLLDINGENVTWKSPEDASKALMNGSEEKITLTAEGFVGKIVRESLNENLGMILKESPSSKGVFIAKISVDSKFSGTDLEEGMKIISIEGIPCPSSANGATKIMQQKLGRLKVVAINVDRKKIEKNHSTKENPKTLKEKEESNQEEVEEEAPRNESKVDEIMKRLDKLDSTLLAAENNLKSPKSTPVAAAKSEDDSLLGVELIETKSEFDVRQPRACGLFSTQSNQEEFSLFKVQRAAVSGIENVKQASEVVIDYSKAIQEILIILTTSKLLMSILKK